MQELVSISIIKPNPENPRTITDHDYNRLKQSIKDFPQMLYLRPIVIDENNVALGGNMRLKALTELGYQEVWIIRANNLTPEQKEEFIVKDNLPYGQWDFDKIRKDWNLPLLESWGLEIPELKSIKIEEDDFTIPEIVPTDIQPGDIFQIGPHRLMCGDVRNPKHIELLMDGKLADMVDTDPPYNVDYQSAAGTIANDNMEDGAFLEFLRSCFTNMAAYTKPGGAWYIWHADSEGLNFRRAFAESGIMMKQCLIWIKNALVMGRQDYQWKHEPCLYGWKPGAAHYFVPERDITTVIPDPFPDFAQMKKADLVKLLQDITTVIPVTTLEEDKPRKNDLHPTMKPIKLIAGNIRNSSRPGQIILDTFAGSGTTMIASDQLQRTAYCMELTPKFTQVIINRMAKYKPEYQAKKIS